MNEFFIKNRLHDYADNTLTTKEKIDIDIALPKHPELMRELKEIQDLRESLIEKGSLKAPDNLFDSILLQTETIPLPSANSNWPSFFSASGLAAAVILIGWFLIPQNPNPKPENQSLIKAAQTVPSINVISIPTSSPIEQVEVDKEDVLSEKPQKSPSEPSAKDYPQNNTNKKSKTTYVIPSPETPYFSPVEEDVYQLNIDVGTTQTVSPEMVTISFAHYRLLFTLQSLAQSNNGRLLSSDGGVLNPFDLSSETPSVRISIEVPESNVSKVYDELRQQGGSYLTESTNQNQEIRLIDIDVRFVDH